MSNKSKSNDSPERPVNVRYPDGSTLSARKPTSEEWDRALLKIFKKEHAVANRELVQVCSIVRTSAGEEIPASQLLARFPASIIKVSNAIESIAGGSDMPTVDGDVVSIDGVSFRAPSLDEWESYSDRVARDPGASTREFLGLLCIDGETDALFSQKPASLGNVVSACNVLAGSEVQIVIKKG